MTIGPSAPGEPGYGEWCVLLTEAGLCSCEGCGGHLVEEVCISCGCRHFIQGPTRLDASRYAARIPVHEARRCADADRRQEERDREHDRQARKRWAAEELGDPQR